MSVNTYVVAAPVAIPANDPAGVEIPLDFSSAVDQGELVPAGCKVEIYLTHPNVNDLEITLFQATGTGFVELLLAAGSGAPLGDDAGLGNSEVDPTVFTDAGALAIEEDPGAGPWAGEWKPYLAFSGFVGGLTGVGLLPNDWVLAIVDSANAPYAGTLQWARITLEALPLPGAGGNFYIKDAGAFELQPRAVKLAGAFVEKPTTVL